MAFGRRCTRVAGGGPIPIFTTAIPKTNSQSQHSLRLTMTTSRRSTQSSSAINNSSKCYQYNTTTYYNNNTRRCFYSTTTDTALSSSPTLSSTLTTTTKKIPHSTTTSSTIDLLPHGESECPWVPSHALLVPEASTSADENDVPLSPPFVAVPSSKTMLTSPLVASASPTTLSAPSSSTTDGSNTKEVSRPLPPDADKDADDSSPLLLGNNKLTKLKLSPDQITALTAGLRLGGAGGNINENKAAATAAAAIKTQTCAAPVESGSGDDEKNKVKKNLNDNDKADVHDTNTTATTTATTKEPEPSPPHYTSNVWLRAHEQRIPAAAAANANSGDGGAVVIGSVLEFAIELDDTSVSSTKLEHQDTAVNDLEPPTTTTSTPAARKKRTGVKKVTIAEFSSSSSGSINEAEEESEKEGAKEGRSGERGQGWSLLDGDLFLSGRIWRTTTHDDHSDGTGTKHSSPSSSSALDVITTSTTDSSSSRSSGVMATNDPNIAFRMSGGIIGDETNENSRRGKWKWLHIYINLYGTVNVQKKVKKKKLNEKTRNTADDYDAPGKFFSVGSARMYHLPDDDSHDDVTVASSSSSSISFSISCGYSRRIKAATAVSTEEVRRRTNGPPSLDGLPALLQRLQQEQNLLWKERVGAAAARAQKEAKKEQEHYDELTSVNLHRIQWAQHAAATATDAAAFAAQSNNAEHSTPKKELSGGANNYEQRNDDLSPMTSSPPVIPLPISNKNKNVWIRVHPSSFSSSSSGSLNNSNDKIDEAVGGAGAGVLELILDVSRHGGVKTKSGKYFIVAHLMTQWKLSPTCRFFLMGTVHTAMGTSGHCCSGGGAGCGGGGDDVGIGGEAGAVEEEGEEATATGAEKNSDNSIRSALPLSPSPSPNLAFKSVGTYLHLYINMQGETSLSEKQSHLLLSRVQLNKAHGESPTGLTLTCGFTGRNSSERPSLPVLAELLRSQVAAAAVDQTSPTTSTTTTATGGDQHHHCTKWVSSVLSSFQDKEEDAITTKQQHASVGRRGTVAAEGNLDDKMQMEQTTTSTSTTMTAPPLPTAPPLVLFPGKDNVWVRGYATAGVLELVLDISKHKGTLTKNKQNNSVAHLMTPLRLSADCKLYFLGSVWTKLGTDGYCDGDMQQDQEQNISSGTGLISTTSPNLAYRSVGRFLHLYINVNGATERSQTGKPGSFKLISGVKVTDAHGERSPTGFKLTVGYIRRHRQMGEKQQEGTVTRTRRRSENGEDAAAEEKMVEKGAGEGEKDDNQSIQDSNPPPCPPSLSDLYQYISHVNQAQEDHEAGLSSSTPSPTTLENLTATVREKMKKKQTQTSHKKKQKQKTFKQDELCSSATVMINEQVQQQEGGAKKKKKRAVDDVVPTLSSSVVTSTRRDQQGTEWGTIQRHDGTVIEEGWN